MAAPDPDQLLVFAHVPPPVHGQSLMVEFMLKGLPRALPGVQIHHIDARFSRDMDDVGKGRLGKVLLAVKFARLAISRRLKTGVNTLYYIPAPAKRQAILRDCILLTLMRPFFRKIILHWHAVGLGDWIESKAQSGSLADKILAKWHRWILNSHHLSIVLTEWNRTGPAIYRPAHTAVVYNGLADPCPDFDRNILPVREKRRDLIKSENFDDTIKVGYIGHCTAEKGIFDFLEAIALANSQKHPHEPILEAIVAGEFMEAAEKQRFENRIKDTNLLYNGRSLVTHLGFVSAEKKEEFWSQCDLLAFPTCYIAESFGLVAVEALAHGITPVTSDWRMLPELMAQCHLPVSRAGDPTSLAHHLRSAIGRDNPAALRRSYLNSFSLEAHIDGLSSAIRTSLNHQSDR
ncbi:glycosyltransferase family 4 protein [bacterium]|nr:glycosyltransferase family 4 protein [bacterium]